MTKLTSGTVALMTLALFTAGCSSSSSSDSDAVSQQNRFETRADDADAMGGRIDGLFNTAFTSMPVSGNATYDGYIGVGLETGGDGTVVLGDAAVTADFRAGTVRGTFDDFQGGTDENAIQSYVGMVRMAGDIGNRRDNSFDATLTGTLTGNGQDIALSGPIFGDFRGTGGRAIAAQSDDTLIATVNGRAVDGIVAIIGQ